MEVCLQEVEDSVEDCLVVCGQIETQTICFWFGFMAIIRLIFGRVNWSALARAASQSAMNHVVALGACFNVAVRGCLSQDFDFAGALARGSVYEVVRARLADSRYLSGGITSHEGDYASQVLRLRPFP